MAEELNNVQEQGKVLIALTNKKGKNKILVPSMDGYESGYTVDGIYVSDGINAIIVGMDEQQLPYGINSEDLHEGDKYYNVVSPIMCSFDGEWRTEWLIGFLGVGEGTALVEANKKGWLPSGGEMALIASKKEEINALLVEAGGSALSDGDYWTSQKFSNERVWSCMMESGNFTLNNGCVDSLNVRPVKSAAEYAEI